MSLTNWKAHVSWATMVALMLGTASLAQAEEGQIIRVGPDRGANNGAGLDQGRTFPQGLPEGQARQAPKYWIGIVGGPVQPAVRHHVNLPEGQGLQVMSVVPGSPAAEGGLQQYDVLVRANDVELNEMRDLVDLVLAEGEKQGQITLEILRGGQTETVWITPAERTDDAPLAGAPFGGFQPGAGQPQGLHDFLGQMLGENGQGFEFRNFGPGVVVGKQLNSAQLPDGTSVKIEKNNDQPTKITIERNGESWEIEGDDPAALDQLPDDVRPYVEQMLSGGGQVPGMNAENWQQNLRQWMPRMEQGGDFQERLQDMERKMEELRQRFIQPGDNDKAKADEFH